MTAVIERGQDIHSRRAALVIHRLTNRLYAAAGPVTTMGSMTYERNTALGAYGERVATGYLESQGMTILDRNWRCRYGELDIIARDGVVLVVCEVKTRSGTSHGMPIEAVSSQKAHRLRRLSAYWLQEHHVQPDAVRIDVISVRVPRRGAPLIEQIAGVA